MGAPKKYQVFVSSTYRDLREEREQVMQALLEQDCIPSGMELFPAANDDQWTLIKRVIDDCDYYLVIIAGRYGSLAPEGISYTQKEYEYAVESKKPVLGFLHEHPGSIPVEKSDTSPKAQGQLKAFRELCEQRHCKYWKSPEDLGGKVSRALIKLVRDYPAVGWVRGDHVPDAAAQTIVSLRAEVDDLKAKLAQVRTEGPPGSEGLAQGNDHFPIRLAVLLSEHEAEDTRTSCTWNELFAAVASQLMTAATEEDMKKDLAEMLRLRHFQHAERVVLHQEDFRKIVLQLVALGLIRKSPRGLASQWTLTEHGESALLKLQAIRK